MSLVIISMMTIVALGIVFADEEVCPCNEDNEGCVPAPIEDVENTNGNKCTAYEHMHADMDRVQEL